MKKLTIYLVCMLVITMICPSFLYASNNEVVPVERAFQLDRNSFFSKLASSLKEKTVLMVDGARITATKIKKSLEIHRAIDSCVPIVITEPTKAELQTITGLGVASCKAAVVIPKKQGEEFDIYVIRGRDKDRKPVRSLQKDDKNIDVQIHTIKSIIDEKQVEKAIVKDASSGASHKRWTVLDVEPYFWGSQGQFIHVGFQFDLYNVVHPVARKYLTVQTVGTGVSAGTLYEDKRYHRGYFQTQVLVKMQDRYYDDWIGNHLKLERYAPESSNNTNTATVTTGATFSGAVLPGVTFTGLPFGNASGGFALSYTKGETSSFHDFTVSFDPALPQSPSQLQWAYWLSGANGAKIRRKHQAYDLVDYTGIRELPELAKESVLMPHMECVYYAEGDQVGTVTMYGTVRQKLLDLKNYVVTHRSQEISDYIDHVISIDFNQVHR